jgi:hypothetical protein
MMQNVSEEILTALRDKLKINVDFRPIQAFCKDTIPVVASGHI